MSDFKRFKRLTKSLIPPLSQSGERTYSWEDARMMINELGLQMPPEFLSYLVERDTILDDFVNSIYELERKMGRRVITDHATIDEELDPLVHLEGDQVGFSVQYKGEPWIFAEYTVKL